MRSSVEDNKGWIGPSTPEISNGFEFQKGSNRTPNHHHRPTIGKPAPSKWDDAQKWLSGVGFARGRGGGEKNSHHSRSNKPRNSNADDLRLIASASQREREGENQYVEYEDEETAAGRLEVETKNVDCGEQVWRKENPTVGIRSVCVRDMGTEMTPFGSQEPSRTATPVRATTPVGRSPVTSPVRGASHGGEVVATETVTEVRRIESRNIEMSNGFGEEKKVMSAMEARAMAWDEAERAKFMARYKREEVKIQAWENIEKRKAEMEMKKMEVKAERMKARAEEKLANKLAATKSIAEERRANAEAKLNEEAVRTSEKADYIRRTGHLPSTFSFSFKLPSRCWCK